MAENIRTGLDDVLARSRQLGFLGPGPIDQHIAHTRPLIEALRGHFRDQSFRAADLGSGGGIPGLIVAVALPYSSWLLIDAMEKRTTFLSWAIKQLDLQGRVEVIRSRAELIGQDSEFRRAFDVVTARSFAPAPVTAECGAPLLRVGGLLAVSEPPQAPANRWSAEGLEELGFSRTPVWPAPWTAFRLESPTPGRYPRPVGRPNKRPLWDSE